MMSRRYPTAEEVERILWDLEKPMTLRAISRVSGVRYDRARYAMISLRYQGLVAHGPRRGSKYAMISLRYQGLVAHGPRRGSKGALWYRRGRYA